MALKRAPYVAKAMKGRPPVNVKLNLSAEEKRPTSLDELRRAGRSIMHVNFVDCQPASCESKKE